MPNARNWFLWTDSSSARNPALQGDSPSTTEFLPIGVSNRRAINVGLATNPNGAVYQGDLNVVPRNAKNIVWSSEGCTVGATNTQIVALTAAQKILATTGKSDLTAPGGGILDVSAFRNLVLMVNVASFTAGSSPSIQFELDLLDDTAVTPNSYALWKPAALTAAGSWIVSLGVGNGVLQAAAAPTAATTGFAALTNSISGLTIESIPLAFPPNARFAWTVTGTPTAISWQAFLYGIH